MEENDDDRRNSGRRLVLSRENFDDYLVALNSKLRSDDVADRILSGDLAHPLILFQQVNAQHLQNLNVPLVSQESLFNDPVLPFQIFIRNLTNALLNAPAPVPAIAGLNQLQERQDEFRRAEKHIYSTIISTLRVGKSLHYARQCPFGAGQTNFF